LDHIVANLAHGIVNDALQLVGPVSALRALMSWTAR